MPPKKIIHKIFTFKPDIKKIAKSLGFGISKESYVLLNKFAENFIEKLGKRSLKLSNIKRKSKHNLINSKSLSCCIKSFGKGNFQKSIDHRQTKIEKYIESLKN